VAHVRAAAQRHARQRARKRHARHVSAQRSQTQLRARVSARGKCLGKAQRTARRYAASASACAASALAKLAGAEPSSSTIDSREYGTRACRGIGVRGLGAFAHSARRTRLEHGAGRAGHRQQPPQRLRVAARVSAARESATARRRMRTLGVWQRRTCEPPPARKMTALVGVACVASTTARTCASIAGAAAEAEAASARRDAGRASERRHGRTQGSARAANSAGGMRAREWPAQIGANRC
jgi:hypothetical protein